MTTPKQIAIKYFTSLGWSDNDSAMQEFQASMSDEDSVDYMEDERLCYSFAEEIGYIKYRSEEGVGEVCDEFVQAIRAQVKAN